MKNVKVFYIFCVIKDISKQSLKEYNEKKKEFNFSKILEAN